MTNTNSDCATNATHGKFCWNELMTRDIERAKKFYADTIGWTFTSMPSPWSAPTGSLSWAVSRWRACSH